MISTRIVVISSCVAAALAEDCSGAPCSDPARCRSRWGWCGSSTRYCNHLSTWKPSCGAQVATTSTFLTATTAATTTTTIASSNGGCNGEPCQDVFHCRSRWGFCGPGSAYCNGESTWKVGGCGVPAPTPAPTPMLVPTTSPTPIPTALVAPTPAPTLVLVPTPSPTPSPPPAGSGIGAWFTQADFDAFFPNIDNAACTGKNFFTHAALVQAAASFPDFANSGDLSKDKLELAAFLGQTQAMRQQAAGQQHQVDHRLGAIASKRSLAARQAVAQVIASQVIHVLN